MQETTTITAAETARLAGVGRAAVSNGRKRHADFPTRVGGTAASPEFDLGQVEQWLHAQGKLPELASADRLWRHLAAASQSPAAGLAAVGALLLAQQRGQGPGRSADRSSSRCCPTSTPSPMNSDRRAPSTRCGNGSPPPGPAAPSPPRTTWPI
ncbi:hypothetical protein [Micromonospora inositola]|uniref:hypothetical protein n=1 Tax=Micromonospora inositola TaxID=47865 RepID=UPI001E50A9E3|nr:hypothetical protein [Micromonospora inositola]